MRPAEAKARCEECGGLATYVESVPDSNVPGTHPSECGYRLRPLCWLHKAFRAEVATARFYLVCIDGDVARIDRGRCGGDVVCEECGRVYYRHPRVMSAPFLTLLCDGSVAKL